MPGAFSDESDTVNLDEVFNQIGQISRYQLLVLLLVGLSATVTSLTAYSFVFIGAQPDFR